ncbi:hypothetical protein J5N97_023170 [Dioscorea zingiberensis]|uniref:KIB1-4 beta-propeller domain-containing protein n=1 Tax=Dioscorea zingiberensis TaxID=325984 RepID=A0A9D5HBP4_9LILI|nr:hypothetical protein J5N97_023170 [Dioscorea zingiberensis]
MTTAAVITLINPFTAARVLLSVLTGCWMSLFGRRVLLSGSPANVQQPPMVVYYSVDHPRQDLKFQRMGDKEWKTIPETSSFAEVIACNGRFYGFDDLDANRIYSIDLQANNGNGAMEQLIFDLPPEIFSGHVPPPRWKFLVDFSGDLVVVCMLSQYNETEYLFLRADFEDKRLVLMPNLGGCLLFQCKSCSFLYRDNINHGSLLEQEKFKHDGRHIVHTGSPNHVIIIFAKERQHPNRRIRTIGGAWALGWITPDLNMES